MGGDLHEETPMKRIFPASWTATILANPKGKSRQLPTAHSLAMEETSLKPLPSSVSGSPCHPTHANFPLRRFDSLARFVLEILMQQPPFFHIFRNCFWKVGDVLLWSMAIKRQSSNTETPTTMGNGTFRDTPVCTSGTFY